MEHDVLWSLVCLSWRVTIMAIILFIVIPVKMGKPSRSDNGDSLLRPVGRKNCNVKIGKGIT